MINKFSYLFYIGLLITASNASPVIEERDVQTVHFVFHGGPASYEMTFPADGISRPTSKS